MKKLFLFAAVAAMFAACSETDVLERNIQQNAANDGAVKFDVYAQRNVTRGGGQTGDLTNANIGTNGFGVFAYYTASEEYSSNAKPNFMYNQQVTCDGEATYGTLWKYEPVKYWPNEYGNAAISDDTDYLTFFAYAPWTNIEPTTGEVIPQEGKDVEKEQNYNIISVNKNSATGDPIVKYVVDTDPATSVDLLWGVAAENAGEKYTPIDGNGNKDVPGKGNNKDIVIEPGKPFMNLVKPNDPVEDRLVFNLKHALAKVKVTIDYIDDALTPEGPAKGEVDPATTRVFVRSFKISGWATQGALNLNNPEPGIPLWKDFGGVKDLSFADVTYFDGRKDGKEGTTSGLDKSEKPNGLNPDLIQTNAEPGDKWVFGEGQNPGITAMTDEVVEEATEGKGTVLLFGGDPAKNGGYFYVIPRNGGENVDVEIAYDIESVDTLLAGTISDNLVHGISIENVIRKEAIFGDGIDFQPGYQYLIKIHVGLTSVKIEATVEPWVDNGTTEVDLPDNQDPDPDAEGENENKPSIEAGTAFNATVSKVKGVAPATGTTLTLTTTGKFLGSYAEVTVEGTIEGITLEDSYYVLASLLKEGSEVELLSITPPTADAEPVDPTPGPSRMTRADEEEGSIDMLYRTNIYVLIGKSSPSQPTEPVVNYYSLSVSAGDGGSIDPYEIAAENKDENGNIKEGTSVTVTASPSEGHTFAGWKVNGENVSTETSYTFTIDGPTVVVANFDEIPVTMFTLTVTEGVNGTVTSTVADGAYEDGTPVKVTATAANGYEFKGWIGNNGIVSTSNPYSFNLTSDITLSASFEGKPMVQNNNTKYTVESTDSHMPNPVQVKAIGRTELIGGNFSGEYYRIELKDGLGDSHYKFVLKEEFNNAAMGATLDLYELKGSNLTPFTNPRRMEKTNLTITFTGIAN